MAGVDSDSSVEKTAEANDEDPHDENRFNVWSSQTKHRNWKNKENEFVPKENFLFCHEYSRNSKNKLVSFEL